MDKQGVVNFMKKVCELYEVIQKILLILNLLNTNLSVISKVINLIIYLQSSLSLT